MIFLFNYTVEVLLKDAFSPEGRYVEIPAQLPIETEQVLMVGDIAVEMLRAAYPMHRITLLGYSTFCGVFKTVGGREPKV